MIGFGCCDRPRRGAAPIATTDGRPGSPPAFCMAGSGKTTPRVGGVPQDCATGWGDRDYRGLRSDKATQPTLTQQDHHELHLRDTPEHVCTLSSRPVRS